MKILRTLLLYGPDSLGLSVIYIKAEGFSGKMLKLRLHATRPSFYREARGGGQTGVGFNQPDTNLCHYKNNTNTALNLHLTITKILWGLHMKPPVILGGHSKNRSIP